MSKNPVGDVYAKVIDDVCKASQTDFEEGGVELATLDKLKTEWQRKLSMLKVANLPWDPKPEPAASSGSSNANGRPAPLPSNGPASSPPSSQPVSAPQIKQENQSYPAQQAAPSVQYPPPQLPSHRTPTALERAAVNLHQQYGNRAGPQIAALQGQASQGRIPVAPDAQVSGQPPTFIKKEEPGPETNGDYKPDVNQIPLKISQTDGAMDEYESEVAARRADIVKYKVRNDQLIKAHVMSSQQELEGGGLLIPLDERYPPMRLFSGKAGKSQSGTSRLARAQGDAAGDDDEDDENAINSDLDDPDELDDPAEQEDGVQEIMLCTYDKVQRVKNKWKCTLKDGILRVDGHEYVFHKGQGEFEW